MEKLRARERENLDRIGSLQQVTCILLYSRIRWKREGDRHMDGVKRDPDYTARRFVTTAEAMQILQCSRPVASRAIHMTNERLKKQGCFTVTGRCNRQAFFETLGYVERG